MSANFACDECSRSGFASASGLGVHRKRAHGIEGTGGPSKSRQPNPCPSCGQPKDRGKGSKLCTACREAQLPVWQQARRDKIRRDAAAARKASGIRPRRPETPEGMKWCGRCEQVKPIRQFPLSAKNSACRACQSEYQFAHRIEKQFGLTAEAYYQMAANQHGLCAICGQKPRQRRLAVDHDHATGAVRGLLCTRCNHKLLGASLENPTILRRAADYLDGSLAAPAPSPGVRVEATSTADWPVEDWLTQAEAQAGGRLAVVWVRQRGQTDPGDWVCLLRARDLFALLREDGQ